MGSHGKKKYLGGGVFQAMTETYFFHFVASGGGLSVFINGFEILNFSDGLRHESTPSINKWMQNGNNLLTCRFQQPEASKKSDDSETSVSWALYSSKSGDATDKDGFVLEAKDLWHSDTRKSFDHNFDVTWEHDSLWQGTSGMNNIPIERTWEFVERLHSIFEQRDVDAYLEIGRKKARDISLALGCSFEEYRDQEKRTADYLLSHKDWGVLPITLQEAQFRLLPNQKIVHVSHKDGQDIFRSEREIDGGLWSHSVYVSIIDNELVWVR